MSEILKDIKWIAAEPRPIGSPANRIVRERLVERLIALGWAVEVQSGKPVVANQRLPVEVHNIVATLPGEERKDFAVFAAHYDSVARGPGAGDDGAAVAAMLQVARQLPALRGRRNDLVILLTDGEEAGPFGGLLGANLFATEHPLSRKRPLVLNFEARGTSGPTVMFETSPGNAWLIERYAEGAWHPVTSSLSGAVYRLMPNKTDLSILIPAGFPALNFVFFGSYTNYHQVTDDIAHLDPRSLGHHAANAVAMARRLAEADLSPARQPHEDVVYFDLLAWTVIRYPIWFAWVLAAITVVLAGVVLSRAERTAGGRKLALALIALSVTVAAVIAAGLLFTRFVWTRKMDVHADLAILAFAILSTGVAMLPVVFNALDTRVLAAAGIAIWTILTVATTVFLPGASFLFAWPALATAIAWVAREARTQPFVGASLGWLAAAIAIVVVLPTYYLGFLGGTLGAAPVAALPAVLLGWCFYPQVEFITARGVRAAMAGVLVLAGAGILAWIRLAA